MQMDKQSAKELVETVLWWEGLIKRAWNKTLGRFFGLAELPQEETQDAQAPSDRR